MTSIRLLEVAPTCSVQDVGRPGYARIGVGRSGPMDRTSHDIATALVATTSPADRTALEVGPGGVLVEAVGGPVTLAVAGPDVRWSLGDDEGEGPAVLPVAAGATLRVTPGTEAVWAYVAAAGGLDVPSVLGSTARHARADLGLRLLPMTTIGLRVSGTESVPGRWPATPRHGGPLMLLPAPQTHLFDEDSLHRLVTEEFTTTTRSDRMGHRLDGPVLTAPSGHDIVSDGIVPGTLQVPGDGRPFVLTADHQTTGGYPKIAVLASADLDRFTQLPPGRTLRFRWATPQEAVEALRQRQREVQALLATPPRPLASTLAASNLIDGVRAPDDEGSAPG